MAETIDVAIRGRDQASKAFKTAGRSATKFGQTSDKAFKKSARSANLAFSAVKGLKVAIGALAGIAAVRGFAAMISGTTDLGDSFQKLNQRLGISVELLSDLRFAGQRSGIEFATMTMGLQRLVRRMEEFKESGAGAAAEGFELLGIADAIRAGATFETLLPRIADGFQRLGSEQQKVLLAMRLFDSEGVKLLQLFTDGAAGIDAYREANARLGGRWNQLAANEAAQMKDTLTDLGTAWGGLERQALETFGPPINQAIIQTTKNLAELNREGSVFRRTREALELSVFGRKPFGLDVDMAGADALGPPPPPTGSVTGPAIPREVLVGDNLNKGVETAIANFKELRSNAIRAQEIMSRGIGIEALKKTREESEKLNTSFEGLKAAALSLTATGMASAIFAYADGTKSASKAVQDLTRNIALLIVQQIILNSLKAVTGGVSLISINNGAKGGIFPVRRMAGGGIADHQQFLGGGTLIRERMQNEAIVPLPNNRSIPVQLKGKTGGDTRVFQDQRQFTINIAGNTGDEAETRETLKRILIEESANDLIFRQQLNAG